MGRNRKRRILTGVLLAVIVTLPSAVTAAQRGHCTTAEVGEPVVFPDGTQHPAGQLTLCLTRDYSPVSSLHAVRVDGASVALLASRRGRGEGGATEMPFMMFFRDGRGRLHLAGYAIPSRGSMLTYDLVDLRASRRARRIAAETRGDRPATGLPTVPAVVLAARVD